MTHLPIRWCSALSSVVMIAFASSLRAADPPLPLPEMVVAKTASPPKLDGNIDPGEWNNAPVCTGFVKAFEGSLSNVQSNARITYDDKFIYVAMTNYRGEKLKLLQKRGRRIDDDAIVFDPSNEVWITPPSAPLATYQTLFNAYPAVFDAKMIPSVGYTSKAWTGKWEIAVHESRESWTIEARVPIASFGVGKIEDNATWRALFTADVFDDGNAFRAWAPGGAFADIPRHGILHFKENSAVFQLLDIESIFTGKPAFPMGVTGPAKGKSDVTVEVRFGAAPGATGDDVVLTKTLSVADGKHEDFTLSTDLTTAKLPSKMFVVDPAAKPQVSQEFKYGFCTVLAKTKDGTVLYTQVFPFVINGFVRKPPEVIETTPYKQPFGLEASYAPMSKKLLVKIDRYYMPNRAQAVNGRVRLLGPTDPGKTWELAQRPIGQFRQDYSDFHLDLTAIMVPVETEKDWAAAKPIVDENKKIETQNKKLIAAGQPPLPLKEVPGTKPLACKLEVVLTDAAGNDLATASADVALMGYEFDWLDNKIGISDKVIPPWTPMKATWFGKVKMWNKQYQMDGLGLAEKIINNDAPQLLDAMKLIAVIDGRRVPMPVVDSLPSLREDGEAFVNLWGRVEEAGLQIVTGTRVEFDGFVYNTMTIFPTTANVEKLSLVVRMPESEAPAFVTTSGGWSAYHGWTPEHWDSRETALGSMVGNFVPYVLLTDSDRGFCFFADNEQGWRLDPKEPTEEVTRENGIVTLKVNFITKPGPIDSQMTIKYGWMVTPQKPQPKGWRAFIIGQNKPAPQATPVFWNDADWYVLWPYYSSPFPHDYAKSKMMLDGSIKRGTVPFVGDIAHSIGRYMDFKGRWFNPVAADWGIRPGELGDADVARSRGPNDFQLWHFDQWVKKSGLPGIYFDENYLGEDWNYLTGGAYLLPDERVQPGYSFLGLREYDKRLRYMFHDNGIPTPNLWLHTTSGQPVYAWMPDVAMEGENVEPTSLENDYIDALPASRIRAIGMGRNLGAAPFIMCQAQRHFGNAGEFLVRQMVGWVLAHDCIPEGVEFYTVMMAEMQMWRDDMQFLPYWKKGLGVESQTPDVLASAHVCRDHAVVWLMNTAREDHAAEVKIDLAKIGLDPAMPILAFDAETGERSTFSGGDLKVALPKRDWRAIRLVQPKLLTGRQTFVAHFDAEAAADEALGNIYPRPQPLGAVPALVAGKTGTGLSLERAVSFEARQHVTQERGEIEFQFSVDSAKSSGVLLAIEPFKLQWLKGALQVLGPKTITAPNGKASLQSAVIGKVPLAELTGWHVMNIAWEDKAVKIALDGKPIFAGTLAEPMPIPPAGRGLSIAAGPKRVQPAAITFGPLKGAVVDDLTMSR